MNSFFPLFIFGLTFFLPFFNGAQAKELILKTHYYQIWEVNSSEFEGISHFQKTTLNDLNILPLREQSHWIQPYLETRETQSSDQVKIQHYLQEKIAPKINQEREDIVIKRNEQGTIEFEGRGFEKRQLDVKKAAEMIAQALEEDITFVHLPIITEAPVVSVLDEELEKMGIKEMIGTGQTNASGSPYNRFYNIDVGAEKFNGHLIEPDKEVSFVEVLGPVNGSTGYVQELVIKGPKTVPEYGGGLCQISSTMFRTVLSAGLPITNRINHSYLVGYYQPAGLDATIYIPNPDFKFINDTGHHILVQTLRVDGDVYYNFYGTDDQRKVHVIGPHYKGRTSPPADRIEYTDTLAPGVVKVLGNAVPGLRVSWYREVEYAEPEKNFLETYNSNYQARPNYRLVGRAAASSEGE